MLSGQKKYFVVKSSGPFGLFRGNGAETDLAQSGDRIPFIAVRRDGLFEIATSLNGFVNYHVNYNLTLKTWHSIVVEQISTGGDGEVRRHVKRES